MLITQSGKFQKFEFQTLAGISSNTGRQESNQIEFTVGCTVLARSRTVAMLLDDASIAPSAPSPDPSREKGRRGEGSTPDPPLFFPAFCMSPTTLPSPASTHSTPQPRPKPPSMRARPPCPVSLNARAQGPRSGELLDAPFLDAPAYKRPRRSNEPTHPVPSYLPDALVSPRLL
jgi:hypothetical protein